MKFQTEATKKVTIQIESPGRVGMATSRGLSPKEVVIRASTGFPRPDAQRKDVWG